MVQKKHPIQSQLNDELTQGLSIKEGKIRIEEAINQARVELEWLQQVVRDWDSNVALLKRQFQEDIHDAQAVFMTADEFFNTIDRNDEPWLDQLVGLGAAQKTEQLAEFASWDKEAHNVFYDQYGGAASEVENQKNGIENGTLDAFRHLYSSAKWALLKGDNWSQELFDGIKHKEWAHSIDPVGEARMDLWNNHVGRIIGQQARKELGSFRAAGDKSTYLQQADVYIAKLTRAAIETGLAASSIEDPRLKVLDIDIVGSDTRPWSLLNLSIKSLFNKIFIQFRPGWS